MVRRLAQWLSTLARLVRQYRVGLVISSTVCVLSIGLYFPVYMVSHPSPLLHFLASVELQTLDMRFRLRGPRTPPQRVVIVAIDQKSQDVLGRWPFPRSSFAQAVDFLRDAPARVIAFDINFPQPDENSALQAIRELRKEYERDAPGRADLPRYEARLKALEAEADNDKRFAEALSRYDNAILGYFFLFSREETAAQDSQRVEAFLNYLSFQAYPQVIHPEFGKLFQCPYCEPVRVSPNLPELAEHGKNFGFVNVIPDADGTLRRVPAVMRFRNSYYPSFDVAAALAYTNLPLDQVAVFFNPNGLERIDFGALALPTDPDGYVQIDFYGPAGTFPAYSFSDVAERKLPKELFQGRLVLIGPTATGIADMAATPFQTMAFPGVEVHANLIENILEKHFIRRGLRQNLVDLGFILLFGLAAGVLLSAVPPVRATLFVVACLGLFLWLAYYLFAARSIWIATFWPTATLALNYVGIVSYRFFFEERQKKKVRGAFQQYVAPGVINQLLERPELLRLGGEVKELTAMFTDIRGFTTISESMSPGALVDLLNEYMSEMTAVIFQQRGTLDKYIGDAIMAFWGAPYPQPDHAERACCAAVEMLEVLARLRGEWEKSGKPRIKIGVGINTGPMLVGNMGSVHRFNFTVMGDNVNLASRLEGLNKQFGTRAIISESTYQAVHDKVAVRELDLIRVKGKIEPVRIYELLGPSEAAERYYELVQGFYRGLEAYRCGQWETALCLFEELHEVFPDDGPLGVFTRRCHAFLANPPAGVWDGVYVMETK